MLYLAYRSISLFFFIYRQGRNHVGDGEFRPIPSLCHSAGDLQIRHNFNLIQSEEINWIYFIQFNKDGTQKQIILYYYWPLNKRINTYIYERSCCLPIHFLVLPCSVGDGGSHPLPQRGVWREHTVGILLFVGFFNKLINMYV